MNYPIDGKHLKAFIILSKTLNMRHASKELHLTPSALSHSLKSLEEDLGCKLFDRTSRKMSLTQSGEQFLPQALRIIELMDQARDTISSSKSWHRGQLRIGASPTACQFIIPAVIREFKDSFSDIAIKIETAVGRDSESLLRDGKIDLALSLKYPTPSSIEFVDTAEDEICFIVNPLHHWAKSQKAQLSKLAEEKIIISSSSTFTSDLLDDYFRPKNIIINPFIEIGNEEVIKQFVQLNLGIGIIPPWIASNEIESGLLVAIPLGTAQLKRQWGVLHSSHKSLSFAEHIFIGITTHVCRNLMRQPDYY